MHITIQKALENITINAIEKILADGRPLENQAADIFSVVTESDKRKNELEKQYRTLTEQSLAKGDLFGLQCEINVAWDSESDIMKRDKLLEEMARANGYNVRTAYRRIRRMISIGMLERCGSFLRKRF